MLPATYRIAAFLITQKSPAFRLTKKHFPLQKVHLKSKIRPSAVKCGASRKNVFVFSLRGPQNISNLWGEEEVRLLYTKRVLLVATSHFRRSEARVFVRWSADFQSGGLAVKARCKLACKRDLRDYTQGRVGRPPRFRLPKKVHLSSIIYAAWQNIH